MTSRVRCSIKFVGTRLSLSLSILSPGDLCNDEASKRTFNACESTMARWCISYPLRASINEFYYPRVGVLEKIRFNDSDNNDNNSKYRPQIRSWKIRRIFITRLWEESRKKIPFWFIFSSINRNTVCKGLCSFIFCIRVHVYMYIRDWIDWWWLNGISLFFLCSWLFVGSKIHGAYFESSKAVDRKIFPVIFLTKI